MDDGQRMDLRVYRERVSGVVRIQGSYLIGGAMSRYEIGKPKTKKKKKKSAEKTGEKERMLIISFPPLITKQNSHLDGLRNGICEKAQLDETILRKRSPSHSAP